MCGRPIALRRATIGAGDVNSSLPRHTDRGISVIMVQQVLDDPTSVLNEKAQVPFTIETFE